MRKSLLSFCVLTLSSAGAWAQSWVAPTLQISNDAIPEKAAIYNVEQKQFLTKGGAWGNHASLGPVENAFMYEIQAQQEEGVYKLYCNKAANNGLLGRESSKDVYTDWKAQTAWGTLWSFEKVEATGNYHIVTAASCPNFGRNKYIDAVTGEYDADYDNDSWFQLGWSPNEQDLTNGSGEPMGTNVGCYMFDMTLDENADVSVEWAFVTEDAFTIYNAQTALYTKLLEAYEIGYTEAELAGQSALLASTDVEAVNAATDAVKQLILDYGYNHATPDNPYDISDVITNPGFDGSKGGQPAGWICTNAVLQNNKQYEGWDEEAGAITDYKVFNCQIEQWTSAAAIPDAADIHQVIKDLPQGTYRLTGWCIATSSTADRAPEGAELYAESGVVRYATIVSMPNGSEGSAYPHLTTVEITHFGGDLTIGYSYNPGFVKWWAADNFKLYYCGPVDNPGLLALTSTYTAALKYADGYDDDEMCYSEQTYESLRNEISTADGIMSSGTSEECQAEAAKLNELMTVVKAEAVAYEKLNNFVQKVQGDVESYTNSIPALGEQLAEMMEEYQDAYNDRLASIEQIDAWIAAYNDVIVAGIKDAMSTASIDNPIEITALFPNMGYEENTAESKTPNGWTCTAGAFKARANTAEVWQESFNCYRVLENLPAGAYKLTAKALSRLGSSADNYASYDPEENQQLSRLYVNSNEVPVADQASGASTEQRYTNDANVGTEDEPIWVPNSMEGARVYFNIDELYNNEVIGVSLADNAPITIGIKHEGDVPGNSWTIWSDFHIYYLGVSSNALYDTMVALAETANEKAGTAMTEEGMDKLDAAVDASSKLNVTSSSEDITEVINALNEALAYNEATEGLFYKLIDKVNMMENQLSEIEIESDYVGFDEMLEAAGEAVSNEMAKSNEQIEAWLTNLPIELVKYVQYPVLNTASENNPGDISMAMANPGFDGAVKGSVSGWSFDFAGDHIGPNDNQRESGAFEFWKATTFDMYQEISGLAEGYYRLSVNGFYRAGNADPNIAAYTENPDSCRDMSLYANDACVLMKNILDEYSTEQLAGEPEYLFNDQTIYAPNTMIQGAAYFQAGKYQNTLQFKLGKDQVLRLGLKLTGKVVDANWCMFDDFQLFYLGTTEPTAIESVAADAQSAQSAIYDLQGRKVSKLQKGLYIQSGKVILVK